MIPISEQHDLKRYLTTDTNHDTTFPGSIVALSKITIPFYCSMYGDILTKMEKK